jgi:hypothetical protein
MAWHDPDTARAEWADAPDAPLDEGQPDPLVEHLEVAKQAVLAYAPALADPEQPPENYRLAQLLQAKNTWNAAYASPSGDFDGMGGFSLSTHPLDWQIRQILRPRSVFGGAVG